MRKLKPNAVVTLGCGGLLFFGTLGILSEVVRPAPKRTTHIYPVATIRVPPHAWSPWVWKLPECNYVNADSDSKRGESEYLVRKHSGREVTLAEGEITYDALDGMRIHNLTDREMTFVVTCYP